MWSNLQFVCGENWSKVQPDLNISSTLLPAYLTSYELRHLTKKTLTM